MDHNVEFGEEVTAQFEPRRPAGTVVSVRLDPEMAERVLALSERQGKKVSQLVREAIANYVGMPLDTGRGAGLGGFAQGGFAQMTMSDQAIAFFGPLPGTSTLGDVQRLDPALRAVQESLPVEAS